MHEAVAYKAVGSLSYWQERHKSIAHVMRGESGGALLRDRVYWSAEDSARSLVNHANMATRPGSAIRAWAFRLLGAASLLRGYLTITEQQTFEQLLSKLKPAIEGWQVMSIVSGPQEAAEILTVRVVHCFERGLRHETESGIPYRKQRGWSLDFIIARIVSRSFTLVSADTRVPNR